jgi:hypothetical protein
MTQPPTPRISFVIGLVPSVTMDQYLALISVITDGLHQYQHLVSSVSADHVPPLVWSIPVTIVAEGVSQDTARSELTTILNQLPSETYRWQLPDATLVP